MSIWDILQLAAGPLIGAVIGIITNYIAVKMLFRPRRAWHIGKWRVPFTPGIIPRRKPALAKALGATVSESLVRNEDLKKSLLSNALTHAVARGVLSLPSVRSCGEIMLGNSYKARREQMLDFVTDRVLGGILSMDIGNMIATQAKEAVGGIGGRNPLIAMFVNDNLIHSLSAPIAEKVTVYLQNEGRAKLREGLETELAPYEDKTVAGFFKNPMQAENLLASLCRRLLAANVDTIVAHFRIADIVENKINAMRPEDLEALVLSVMRRELNAVIWLGGLIGFIMGLINLFIGLA